MKNVIFFFFRNIAEPSLTKDYSLLDEGDTIKSIAISPYFLYRLEARERGSNGAIYQAPESYRFACLIACFYCLVCLCVSRRKHPNCPLISQKFYFETSG